LFREDSPRLEESILDLGEWGKLEVVQIGWGVLIRLVVDVLVKMDDG
jgi:hypothetical protein